MSNTSLYPPLDAFDNGFLSVSDRHTLHYQQSGNIDGLPVVILHGGPGGGLHPDDRRYFNPEKWRVIQFSQRGCGESTPFAELRENTTWDLVEDIEKLRRQLGISQWAVFGGSWGSTLSLAYAQRYPAVCLGLFLRGIFMVRPHEIQWFYQQGASRIYPDAWDSYLAPIPVDERGNMIAAYYKRLTSDDAEIRKQAARAWSIWEGSTSKLIPDPDILASFGKDEFAEAFARIECHYFMNNGFFDEDDYLLKRIDQIRHLPGVIVQGRYDVVCPAETAWELHKAWPEALFHLIADAGHSVSEKGIITQLIQATDSFSV